jgi:purine catabolism regulator
MSLPTVASLCATLGGHLSPADGFTAREVEVSAVHISELLDPAAYLSGGELLLTTGLALPQSAMGCRRYVNGLVAAEVRALVLGLGPVHDAPPAVLAEACREAGLTLLLVPASTPFLTVTQAYWKARSRSTEQQLSDAVAAHRALVDAAVSPDPAAAVLRRLARLLDGWTALLDASGGIEQVFPERMRDEADPLHAEVERLQLAGPHSSATFRVGEHVVVVFPLIVQDRVVGYLAAASPRQLDVALRRVVLTAAALLSLDVVREERAGTGRGTTRRVLALLVDAGMVPAARLLASEERAPLPRREATVLVTRSRESQAVLAAVETWCPDALGVVTDRATAWFLLPDGHGPLPDLVLALRSADPATSAVASALTALDRVGPTRTRLVQRLATLPAGRVLLPRRHDVDGLHEAIEAFLAEAGPEVRAALVAYLRHRGQWEQAAKSLALHRNTLRYRVGRARELLGLDLDDPDVAAETWLALRAVGVA